MHAWVIWLIAAGVFAIAETLSVDFVLLMIAGGALAAAGVAALAAPVALQFAVFAVAAVALVGVVRPMAKRRLELPHHERMGIEALIGKNAVVTRTVDQQGGRVKLAGEEWSAEAYDPTQVLEIGRTVKVMEIRGAAAIVWAAEP
ncbi:MAG TPA: NfeD family protein [Mycobacteriales bacterium]|nr:NfeD family protein [Mycobacteriales bacterium]